MADCSVSFDGGYEWADWFQLYESQEHQCVRGLLKDIPTTLWSQKAAVHCHKAPQLSVTLLLLWRTTTMVKVPLRKNHLYRK